MSSSTAPASGAYRADVDGLRAVAVTFVVAYHAMPGWIPGGFVGVDVFFVISGYLITGILARAQDAGTFGFLDFYARRARRIFPALVLVLLATVALGAVLLTPLENVRLGRHVAAGTLFASNLLLWHEAGYFDAASAAKPLLHLWSLGIEEQFYLAWPAVMLLLSRAATRRYRLMAVVLIAVASFAISVGMVSRDASAAFYSPASRAWELMAGAILALLAARRAKYHVAPRARDASSIVGAALLLIAVATFDSRTPFPGFAALLPVLGASLLVVAGPDAWVNRRILSGRVAVSLGLVSYPLYLWHWPLLVMMRHATGAQQAESALAPGAAASVVILSIGAAYATYLLLERPLKTPALFGVATRASLALAALGVLGGVMMLSRAALDRDSRVADAARNDWATPKSPDDVYFVTAGHDDPRVVFVGDSHVEQYFPGVKFAIGAGPPGPTIAFSTLGGCPFLPGYQPDRCGRAYARGIALATLPTVRRVVIASAWDMYSADGRQGEGSRLTVREVRTQFDALTRDVARLRALGKEVVIIGPHPHASVADPELLAAHMRFGRFGTLAPTQFATSFPLAAFRERTAAVNAALARLAARTGATLIDPAVVLCPDGACLTTDDQGTPLRKDSNHLRPFAAVRYLTYVPALIATAAFDGDARGGTRPELRTPAP